MNKNNPSPLATSLGWKLWLFAGLAAVAALGFLFADVIGHVLGVDPLVVKLAISLPTLIAFGAVLLSVRCLHCGLGLVAYAISHQAVGQWLSWLLAIKNCPQCGKSEQQKGNDATWRQGE